MPDIKLNSKIFNPNMKRSKMEDASTLRDLKYQYFQKHDEDRKAYRAQRQFTSKDTQIKFSQNRDSASFLLLLKQSSTKQTLDIDEAVANKFMSVDELVGDFVKQNEHHVRQFAP